MKVHTLERFLVLPRSPAEVALFFADPANLVRLTPPWLDFRILTPLPLALRRGTLIDYRIRLRGVPLRWRSLISAWDPPRGFIDEQVRGPYRLWIHEHLFEPAPGGTRVTDRVQYAAPGGALVHRLFVAPDLERIFDHRAARAAELLGPEGAGRG